MQFVMVAMCPRQRDFDEREGALGLETVLSYTVSHANPCARQFLGHNKNAVE